MTRQALAFFAAALLCASGCTSTETGNPPAAPDPFFDLGAFNYTPVPDHTGVTTVLSGEVSDVVPEGSTVRAIPLVPGSTATYDGFVDAMGAFNLTVGVDAVYRLEVIAPDGTRFQPLDLVVTEVALAPTVVSTSNCLEVQRLVQASGSPRVATLEIMNGCGQAVTLGAPTSRLGLVTADPNAPLVLLDGASTTIRLTLDDAVPADGEDIVFWSIAPGGGTLAVTVYGVP